MKLLKASLQRIRYPVTISQFRYAWLLHFTG